MHSSDNTLALKYHPDRNEGSRQSEEKFLLIQEAYETLINPEKRRIFNSQSVTGFYYNTPENLHHYFSVSCNTHTVKVNQEFEVTYTYTGEGRFFVKPSFNHFFISSSVYLKILSMAYNHLLQVLLLDNAFLR